MTAIVIMAGGAGTRFWPASRRARPKQFLAIGGERSLLRQTADRVLGRIAPIERIYVVTGAEHAGHVLEELPELPKENVLVEPIGRNTAPCIGWACRVIKKRHGGATPVAVLPADHFIADAEDFARHIEAAMAQAGGEIALLGLVPTRPETGYGYIRRGAQLGAIGGLAMHAVERFVEKPDRATAERYLAEGAYLWNSGMFVFEAAVMERAIEKHLPALATGLDALEQEPQAIGRIYPGLPEISIDYGVIEKAEGTRVLPAGFAWSDVGSWDAAMEVHSTDAAGNVVKGDALLVDTHRSMVEAAGGRLVALVDVDDLIVVDTPDALLVLPRGRSQDVKKIVEALKLKNRKELL